MVGDWAKDQRKWFLVAGKKLERTKEKIVGGDHETRRNLWTNTHSNEACALNYNSNDNVQSKKPHGGGGGNKKKSSSVNTKLDGGNI